MKRVAGAGDILSQTLGVLLRRGRSSMRRVLKKALPASCPLRGLEDPRLQRLSDELVKEGIVRGDIITRGFEVLHPPLPIASQAITVLCCTAAARLLEAQGGLS